MRQGERGVANVLSWSSQTLAIVDGSEVYERAYKAIYYVHDTTKGPHKTQCTIQTTVTAACIHCRTWHVITKLLCT